MKYRMPSKQYPVTIEHKGKTYRGSYYVERGKITVSLGYRQTSRPVAGLLHQGLAMTILRDLVADDPEKW